MIESGECKPDGRRNERRNLNSPHQAVQANTLLLSGGQARRHASMGTRSVGEPLANE